MQRKCGTTPATGSVVTVVMHCLKPNNTIIIIVYMTVSEITCRFISILCVCRITEHAYGQSTQCNHSLDFPANSQHSNSIINPNYDNYVILPANLGAQRRWRTGKCEDIEAQCSVNASVVKDPMIFLDKYVIPLCLNSLTPSKHFLLPHLFYANASRKLTSSSSPDTSMQLVHHTRISFLSPPSPSVSSQAHNVPLNFSLSPFSILLLATKVTQVLPLWFSQILVSLELLSSSPTRSQ